MEKKSLLEKFGLIEKVETEKTDFAVKLAEKEKEIESCTIQPEKKVQMDEHKEDCCHTVGLDDCLARANAKKLMHIDEIYKYYNINSQGLNSLSIVERYQKALPDYMPADVKRQSILNIIESSDVKIENLLKDGNDKLRCLNDFSHSFSDESGEIIIKIENEIKKLTEKINYCNQTIVNLKKLQSEQEFTVKYETEKINNILQFINYEK